MKLRILAFAVLGALTLCSPIGTSPAAAATDEYRNLDAKFGTAKLFPSLTPRSMLRIKLDSVLESEFKLPHLDRRSTYVIERKTDKAGWKRLSPEALEGIRVPDKEEGDFPEVVYVLTRPGVLKDGETIHVGIRAIRKNNQEAVTIWDREPPPAAPSQKREVPVKIADLYTVKATPKQAQDAELIDGTKDDTYRLGLDIDVPVAFAGQEAAHFFFASSNMLSLESKDKASKVQFKFGAERNLHPDWYTPFVVSTEVISNQRFDEVSSVTSAGMKTILPWRIRRGSMLYNSVLQAPFSPTVDLNAQFQHRLERNHALNGEITEKSNLRFHSDIHWNPIYLFVGHGKKVKTKVMKKVKDENGVEREVEQEVMVRPLRVGGPDNISLDVRGRLWFFPDITPVRGDDTSKLYKRLDVALFIPLGKVPGALDGLLQGGAGETVKRIRIGYETGANEASNFTRNTAFTIGLEVLK